MEEEMNIDRQYCSCYCCNNLLRGIEEMRFGVCEPHLDMLFNKRFYIGVCWECGSITTIGDRHGIIPSKYIFAKGCKRCSNEHDSIQWMTILKDTPPTSGIGSKGNIHKLSQESPISNTNIR